MRIRLSTLSALDEPKELPVLQIMEEIVEVIQLEPGERTQEPILETIQTILKIVEVPQTQSFDQVVDAPR